MERSEKNTVKDRADRYLKRFLQLLSPSLFFSFARKAERGREF